MDVQTLIETIYQASSNQDRTELVHDLVETICSQQLVVINNLRRLFLLLEQLLIEANPDAMVLAGSRLAQALIEHLLPSELESHFPQIMYTLLTNLGSRQVEVRRISKRLLVAYVQRTGNVEQVIASIAQEGQGFSSGNFYVRQKCVKLLPRLLRAAGPGSLFTSQYSLNLMRRMLENAIVLLEDKVASVRAASGVTLLRIKQLNFENFDNAFRRLSFEHQGAFSAATAIEARKLQNEQFVTIMVEELGAERSALESFGDANYYEQYLREPLPRDEYALRNYFQSCRKPGGDYFGFLSEENLLDCFNERDVRVRVESARELAEGFFRVWPAGFPRENTRYFLKLLSHLLEDDTPVVEDECLRIANKVVDTPGLHVSTYLNLLIPILVPKLGYEQVSIRQRALALLRKIFRPMRKTTLLKNVMLWLDARTPEQSWHAQEELLHLICFIFLESDQKELQASLFAKLYQVSQAIDEIDEEDQPAKNGPRDLSPTLDFRQLVTKVAGFLDSPVHKVRKASLETLAVICQG